LRRQLDEFMKQKQKTHAESTCSDHSEKDEATSNPLSLSSEDEPLRRTRRKQRPSINSNDFRVEIPKFEGKLSPDEFLEWMYTIECIFEYKDVPEDKKVKLVAVRLRKYASLWWTNLCAKRVRNRKSKIRTWEKMKAKLRSRFLLSTYIQDSYSQLHNLTQGGLNVEEYTHDFKKLMIKCDIQGPEEQTTVRYV